MSYTNSRLWDNQIELNEIFIDMFEIMIGRIGLLTWAVIIIFIWLGILTWFIYKNKKVN